VMVRVSVLEECIIEPILGGTVAWSAATTPQGLLVAGEGFAENTEGCDPGTAGLHLLRTDGTATCTAVLDAAPAGRPDVGFDALVAASGSLVAHAFQTPQGTALWTTSGDDVSER